MHYYSGSPLSKTKKLKFFETCILKQKKGVVQK